MEDVSRNANGALARFRLWPRGKRSSKVWLWSVPLLMILLLLQPPIWFTVSNSGPSAVSDVVVICSGIKNTIREIPPHSFRILPLYPHGEAAVTLRFTDSRNVRKAVEACYIEDNTFGWVRYRIDDLDQVHVVEWTVPLNMIPQRTIATDELKPAAH